MNIPITRLLSICGLFFTLIFCAIFELAAGAPENDILVDKVHANDFSDVGLRPDEYDYHKVFGFRYAFEYLRHQGVRTSIHSEGRLDAEKLESHRLLFINLVSAERPPFYVSEIKAIVDFVEKGGSLFVITDHSNAYFHAWRLAPLLAELDITVPTDTVCDVPPLALGTGNGWILIEKFDKHPITEGLRRIHFQTGGCVDERHAVAWTSPESWADAWYSGLYGEQNGLGYYGNWKQDEGERNGPLGVVLAKEFGKGRIVIVGDQNIFSDVCIDYADNYRLWLNAVAWLLRTDMRDEGQARKFPDLANPAEYRKFREPKILLAEDFRLGLFGTDYQYGFYHFANVLRRNYPLMVDDRYEESYELVVLPGGFMKMDENIVDLLAEHLQKGKKVLALQTNAKVYQDEESVLVQTLKKMKIDPPASVQKEGLLDVTQLESGGKIYLFPPEYPWFNNALPPPEQKPSPWFQPRIELLEGQLKLILDSKTE